MLEQRFHHVEKERDELYEKFESTIYDVQQKSGFKNILLEYAAAAYTVNKPNTRRGCSQRQGSRMRS